MNIFLSCSGVLGSGLCVFSKWIIQDVFFHQWPLNGYIHKIHHGDWFGGKGVGLCQIQVADCLVNIYCTHVSTIFHARKDNKPLYYKIFILGLPGGFGRQMQTHLMWKWCFILFNLFWALVDPVEWTMKIEDSLQIFFFKWILLMPDW